jgi:hypothetical protein
VPLKDGEEKSAEVLVLEVTLTVMLLPATPAWLAVSITLPFGPAVAVVATPAPLIAEAKA